MSQKRVLWADDDYVSFPLVERVVRQCGASVDPVITLSDALSLLQQRSYCLVIMDAILPKGGEHILQERYAGAELFRAARSLGVGIIVLSIVPERELPFAGKESGSYKYFLKMELGPRLDEFRNTVATYLSGELPTGVNAQGAENA